MADNDHPKYLFVCDEETTNPAVQRVDLSKPAASNATTIVTGLSSCDPVRRTPWGTIIVASGESAYVNIQHRAANDALGAESHGALVKISGFKVKKHDHDDHDDWR